jgi:hypothetical protein
MSPRLRSLFINISILTITVVIMLLLTEVLLRVLWIQPMNIVQPHMHRPSAIPGLVYELIPNTDTKGFGPEHITINSEGFRSPERDKSKPVVAVVGDSYVFGHGVNNDQTNPAILQEHFPTTYVLNSGVGGYTIEQEALTMKYRLAPLHPIVVIVEFVFNDFMPKGYVNDDGTIFVGQGTPEENEAKMKNAITQEGFLNFPGKFFLQKHSAVFNFVERTTKGLPFRAHAPADTRDPVTTEELALYKKWFTMLDDAVETKHKIFVIWPESNMHTESRAFLTKLATERGYVVVDLYDTLGSGHITWMGLPPTGKRAQTSCRSVGHDNS